MRPIPDGQRYKTTRSCRKLCKDCIGPPKPRFVLPPIVCPHPHSGGCYGRIYARDGSRRKTASSASVWITRFPSPPHEPLSNVMRTEFSKIGTRFVFGKGHACAWWWWSCAVRRTNEGRVDGMCVLCMYGQIRRASRMRWLRSRAASRSIEQNN